MFGFLWFLVSFDMLRASSSFDLDLQLWNSGRSAALCSSAQLCLFSISLKWARRCRSTALHVQVFSLPIAPAKKADTLSIRSFATFGFALFVCGLAALELPMLLSDLVTADFPSLVRSLSRVDFLTFASDCSHVGPFSSVKALAWIALLISFIGLCRFESQVSALDFAQMDFSVFVRSLA